MTLNTIGIVGLGLLGRGIAACLLSRGLRVVALDANPEAMRAAQIHVDQSLLEMVRRGVIPAGVHESWRERFTAAEDFDPFQICDFVIESVVENLQAKQDIFWQLEEVLSDETPIGSNTSALPITHLQAECRCPARIVGMHWAEPCHLTRFLEVIRGELTSAEAAQAAMELGVRAGKDPALVQKDVPGFIVNRLGYALYREAIWLLENGVADVETIDRSFRNAISVWANVAGPFRWMDLTGLPAYAAVMERLFPQLNNQTDVPQSMQKLMAGGAQGVGNGRGFYDYSSGEAEHWEHLLTENVWQVNAMLNELQSTSASTTLRTSD